MFKKSNSTGYIITGILLGGLIGSAITLLFTPKSGEEVREDIKDNVDKSLKKASRIKNDLVKETRTFSTDIISKANQVLKMSKEYAGGLYEGSSDAFLRELNRLKKAVNVSIETYKGFEEKPKQTPETSEGFTNDYSDDNLPKSQGMGRREDKI